MPTRVMYFLYALLAINVLYVISGILNFPMESVDVLGIWLFKAKAFYIEGGFPWLTLRDPDFFLFHPQYPLLLPAVYGAIYSLLGRVWELPVLLLYPGYYVAILWLVFMVLRKLGLTKLQALTYVYIYSMFSPLLGQAGRGHAGSADIVIVLCSWMGIWVLQRSESSLFRSGILVAAITGVASQMKMEGLFLASLLVGLPTSWVRKMLLIVLAATPFVGWSVFVKVNNIPTDFTFVVPSIFDLIYRAGLIIWHTGWEMVNIKNWYLFWPLVVLALRFGKPARNQFVVQLKVAACLVAAGFVMVYLTVTTDMEAHIISSIDRVLLQVTPFIFPVFVWYSQASLKEMANNLKGKAGNFKNF